MNATPRATFQQQRIHHFSSKIDSLEYFNLLTSDELAKEVQALLPDHRERLFPPTETLSLFLAQVMSPDQSCQQTVNQAAIERLASGLPACSTHTQGLTAKRGSACHKNLSRISLSFWADK